MSESYLTFLIGQKKTETEERLKIRWLQKNEYTIADSIFEKTILGPYLSK